MKPSRSLASLATALAATAALAAAGCVQNDDQTTLLADGSGTMSQTITLDLSRVKEIEDFVKNFTGGAPGADGNEGGTDLGKVIDALTSEKALREQLKGSPGVEVKSLTSEVKDGKRVVNVDLAFADFSSLGKGGFQTTGVALKKNDDGTWTLTFDGLAGKDALLGGGQGGVPPGTDLSALAPMFEPFFGGLSFQRKLTVPGKIVSTNGTASEDGKSVQWKVTWKDVVAGLSPAAKDAPEGKVPGQMTVTFKGDGLTLKPFTYRPDGKDLQDKIAKSRATTPADAPKPAPPPAPVTPTEK